VIVTSIGAHPGGEDRGHVVGDCDGDDPLTKQVNTLMLWIVGAGVTMIIRFALGLYRGQSWRMLFNTA
jgi:hypothetical protein